REGELGDDHLVGGPPAGPGDLLGVLAPRPDQGVQVLVGRVGRDVDQEELLDGPGDGGQGGDPGGRAALRGRPELPGAITSVVAGRAAVLCASDIYLVTHIGCGEVGR